MVVEEDGKISISRHDMSDSTEYCSVVFKLYVSNGVRACGRANSSTVGSCQSVKFLMVFVTPKYVVE